MRELFAAMSYRNRRAQNYFCNTLGRNGTCNTRLDNTGWNRRNSWCCAVLFLFSWLDTERLSGRAKITSLVSMRSVCAVSRSVIRCVLRVLRSPEHTITTNALHVSDSAGKVLSTNPKEKLGFEQRSGATDFRSKGYRVSTCSFPTYIRFRS